MDAREEKRNNVSDDESCPADVPERQGIRSHENKVWICKHDMCVEIVGE